MGATISPFNIWQPSRGSDLGYFLYNEINVEFVRMIFRLLKVDMGEVNIGKQINTILKIKLKGCLRGRYLRATGIRVKNGR